eukprot:468216-Pleurochrysis_carterae.AAC.1
MRRRNTAQLARRKHHKSKKARKHALRPSREKKTREHKSKKAREHMPAHGLLAHALRPMHARRALRSAKH